ncbi:MAG TPA: hypothetical protein VMV73_04415 [Candidatus Dormibacteraeota bacterium]|nr:hypothetical protein [Candidatus Dormibacteraeota bacterium]
MPVSTSRRLAGAVILALALAPAIASATVVSAKLVPDGSYLVRVEAVKDAKHALVMLPNGVETVLSATGSVTFENVKANQSLRVSIVKGKTPQLAPAR